MSREDAHDVWYYEFMKSGAKFKLDVDTDEATAGTLTVFINHRLEDGRGRFLGVTGVALNMDQVGRILRSYREEYKQNGLHGGFEGIDPDAPRQKPYRKGLYVR